MKESCYDCLILGGGPCGCTAALYAARAGLRTVMLEKLSPGGQMALTHQVDNYPGFPEGVDGFTLAQEMHRQAERFGAETVYAEARRVRLSTEPKQVETNQGIFLGRTVILATGAVPRTLGLPGEAELTGRGVAYCAACDGMFYRGKDVVVVGGGNSAAAGALFLSRIARRVLLVHRRDSLRAEQIFFQPLREAENVEFRWNSVVTALLHDTKLTGIRLRDTVTGAESSASCDGLFVSIGQKPATELVLGQLDLDGSGYAAAGENTETSVPGVFAAGDVRAKPMRQIVTAVADGAVAAHQAEVYLSRLESR